MNGVICVQPEFGQISSLPARVDILCCLIHREARSRQQTAANPAQVAIGPSENIANFLKLAHASSKIPELIQMVFLELIGKIRFTGMGIAEHRMAAGHIPAPMIQTAVSLHATSMLISPPPRLAPIMKAPPCTAWNNRRKSGT